uniref:Uncharacterized protein n=1 Tax=viral metagenome TaxID=1070528 RepID=A0A6M3JH82_9ZZZZ
MNAPTKDDVTMVLNHCGPRRMPGAAGKTTTEAATAWMRNLLLEDNGAEAIATAIMGVYYAMTCHEE